MGLEDLKILRTASHNSKFTLFYKKKAHASLKNEHVSKTPGLITHAVIIEVFSLFQLFICSFLCETISQIDTLPNIKKKSGSYKL